MKHWSCPSCGERVILARTRRGLIQRLNFFADPAGNTAAWCNVAGAWHARYAPPDEVLIAPEKRYMPHEATCPAKAKAVPKIPPAANVLPFRRRKRVPP